MKIEFKESFVKDLRKIGEKSILRKVDRLIKIAERAASISEIPGIKKLAGAGSYFRVRIGDYRVGLAISAGTIIFVRILHRKEVYRYFP